MEIYMFSDIKELLSLNLKDYENIGVDFEINKFLLFLAIGLCAASFVINYRRSLIIDTVKQLFRHNATGEENAKTLTELGLMSSSGIRKAVVSDSQLRKMIRVVGEVNPTYDEYLASTKRGGKKLPETDITTARIYIPDESLERAKFVYNTYSTSLLKTILLCVFIIAVTVCLILVSPSVITTVDSILS